MAVNQQGIAISIRAFLPMGKSLDDQLAALSLVKTAHETGDYAALLTAAQDVEVKTDQKTRRVEITKEMISDPSVPVEAKPAHFETPAATQQAREDDALAQVEPETPLPLDPTPAKRGRKDE